jgi:hypothetical protein
MSQKELHMRPKKKEAKLIKDYDCIIDYHSGKENVLTDVSNKKNNLKVKYSSIGSKREIIKLRRMNALISLNL